MKTKIANAEQMKVHTMGTACLTSDNAEIDLTRTPSNEGITAEGAHARAIQQ